MSLCLRTSTIAGTGAYLPSKVLTNADLERMVETTDDWITSRTGIKERRIAADNEFTSDLGYNAAKQALENSGLSASDIDLIIVATCTPDTIFPSTACRIQHALGANRAAAFDLSAACSGFLYGYVMADRLIASGGFNNILVIGAEKVSSVVNWTDRNTCVLFGDGAGAIVLTPGKGRGLITSEVGADGSEPDILAIRGGGCRLPVTPEVIRDHLNCIHMSGKEVFKKAVTAMNESAGRCIEKSGVSSSQIRWVIPHQANMRIISALGSRVDVPFERIYVNLDRYGNMSAACIPVALHELVSSGQIDRGDIILMTAFGGGLTWASAIVEW